MLKRMRKGLCFVLVCVMLLTSVQGVALTAEPYDLPTFSEEEVTARPEAEDATLTEETLFNTELLIETLLGEDTFFYLEPCEQIVSEATLYDNFEGDAVVVVLNRAVSRDNRKFTTSDFGDIGAIYVEDLDRLSNRENSYAQPLWDAESRVYALEYVLQYSLETENIHSRMHDILYLELQETVEQYETLREAGEENTLVNFDEYRRILLIRLEQSCKENVLYVIQQLQYHDYVHVAQPNYIFEPDEIQDDLFATELGYMFGPNAITPNDPDLWRQWAVDKLSLPQAWSITTGSPTVRVGIVGHGIDANHPELIGRVSALSCGRLTEVNTGSINPNEPRLGLGTRQAGIIGATGNNGIGIAGIAWNVELVSVGVGADPIRPGRSDMHATGIANARNAGIPILTRSWSGANNVSHAVQNYTGLFINSAGNNGVDLDNDPRPPDNSDRGPRLPGVSNAIIVGASDEKDARAVFNSNESSNYGADSVHLFAPGWGIWTTIANNSFYFYDGTSAAAPHVAGVAALVLSVNPELTPRQVREVILASVDPVPALANYSISGGRLNAYRAVQLAGETDTIPTRHIEFYANFPDVPTGAAEVIIPHNATTNTSVGRDIRVVFGGVRTGSAENARYNQIIRATGALPPDSSHVFSNLRDGRLEASGGSAYGPTENIYWLVNQTRATTIFGGWFNSRENANAHTSQEGRISPTDQVPEGRETLVAFARWYPTRTVRFNPQGGTWPAGADVTTDNNLERRAVRVTTSSNSVLGAQTLHYGQVLDSNNQILSGVAVGHHGMAAVGAPTRAGYAFNGWWIASTGGTRVTDTTALPTGTATVTLHARWVADTQTHTITLDAGTNGTWGPVPPGWTPSSDATYITRTVADGTAWATIAFPEPTAVGAFRHTDWTPAHPTTGNIGANFTSTAQWVEDVQTRTLTFDAGAGGSWTSIPYRWNGTIGERLITLDMPIGSNWTSIPWPEAGNVTRSGHTPVIPPRPTGTLSATCSTTWAVTWTVTAPATRQVRFNGNFSSQRLLIRHNVTTNARVQDDVSVLFSTVSTGAGSGSRFDQLIGATGALPTHSSHIFSNLRDGRLEASGNTARTATANRYWMMSQTQATTIFGGWFSSQVYANAHTSQGGRISPTDQVPAGTGVLDVFARWYPTRTVTFNPQGGTWSAGADVTTDNNLTRRVVTEATPSDSVLGARALHYGQVLDSNNRILSGVAMEHQNMAAVVIPTRVGHTFTGWWTARTGGTRVTDTTALPTGDVTLYAQWVADVQTRTLTFDAGTGGSWTRIPYGWYGTVGERLITQNMPIGSNWTNITWPAAGNVARSGHTPVIPPRPTGTLSATCGTTWAVTWTVTPPATTRRVNFHGNLGIRNVLIQHDTATNARVQDDVSVSFSTVSTGAGSGSQFDQIIRATGALPTDSSHVFSNLRDGRLETSGNTAQGPTANRYWLVSQTQATTIFGGWFNSRGNANAYTSQEGRVSPTDQVPAGTGTQFVFARWYPTRTVTFNPQGGTWTTGADVTTDNNLTRRVVTEATPSNSVLGARTLHYGQVLDSNNRILSGVAMEHQNMAAVGAPTRGGYVFNGWWTTARTGGIRVTDTTALPTGNVTLHARWVADTQTRTLTFDAGAGGSWTSIPYRWNGTIGERLITLDMPIGSNWTSIPWPEAGNVTRSGHTPVIPPRPTGTLSATCGTTWAVTWTVTPPATTRQVRFNGNGHLLIRHNPATNAQDPSTSALFSTVSTGAGPDSQFDQVIGATGALPTPTHSLTVFSNLRDGRLEASGNTAQTATANRYWLVSQTQTSSVFGGWFSSQAQANAHTSQEGRISPTDQVPVGTGVLDVFARGYPTQTVTFNPQRGTWPTGAGVTTGNLTRRVVTEATPSDSVLGARALHYGQVLDSNNRILSGVAMEHQNMAAVGIPTRAGYTFNGWWTASTGGTRVTDLTALPTGNVTLHAQWIR